MYDYKIKTDTLFTTLDINFTNHFNNIDTLHRTFLTYTDAFNFIRGHMRDYLISYFIKYVQNSINLAGTETFAYYKTLDRCEALDICIKFYADIYLYDLASIYNWILTNQKPLKIILPSPSSESYKTSKMQLKELSDFAAHIHSRLQLHE